MARNRRDPRREKALDMRSMREDRLMTIFYKCHPEYDWRKLTFPDDYGAYHKMLEELHRIEDEWIHGATGGRRGRHRYCGGTPPAWFRRGLNRLRRARARQAMREQIRHDGDVLLPRQVRNVRWLWW